MVTKTKFLDRWGSGEKKDSYFEMHMKQDLHPAENTYTLAWS